VVPLTAPDAAAPTSFRPVPSPVAPAGRPDKAPGARPAPVPAASPAQPRFRHRVAGAARLRTRHFGLILSFFAVVLLPALVSAWYLFFVAEDQYASNLGFSVQREDGSSSVDLLGGLTQIAAASTPDPTILYKYIVSRDMIRAVEQRIDVERAFTRPGDPFYSLAADASIEERERHWERMVKVFLDSGSGLIEVRVRAYTPEDAKTIADAIRDESAKLLNQLSDTAKADATRFARSELETATRRLTAAKAAMTEFRVRTQIVDPATDFAGRMGLLNSLLAQQANALIERDILRASSTYADDPRFEQIERRIEVISKRIEAERARISTSDDGTVGYAELVSEYESLRLETEFAEHAYVTALANLDSAVATAQRNSRYLAVYMPPTLAETAEYPQRITLSLLVAGLLFVFWSILALSYYAVRDRQ
jgi:capsular polysaccharide transport system permease protein